MPAAGESEPFRMSTITDVAREAGVSVATVSRALRGLDRVSPQTRDKVLEVAARLHYVASPTATSLASGRTRVVGVVAPFLTRWFFATMVSAIEKELRRHGHHVLLLDLEDDAPNSRLSLTQEMLWKRVDGLVTLNIPLTGAEVDLLDLLHLPAVAIGTPVPGRPLVCIDDVEAMRTATEHILSLGHEHIAYIGAVPENIAHVQTPAARLDSFRETMHAHGRRTAKQWVLGSQWTADSAHADALRLLRESERPTAIVAASDEMAIGVLAAASSLGLRVPQDLSVIGIDDFFLSRVLGLTTVAQDVVTQGQTAAAILLETLLHGIPLPVATTTIAIRLVVRASTSAPALR